MPSHADDAPAAAPLSAGEATVLSGSVRVFSTAGRVRPPYALLERERTVAELLVAIRHHAEHVPVELHAPADVPA